MGRVVLFLGLHHMKSPCCVPILLTTLYPEPQRNISIAAVQGAVHPSKRMKSRRCIGHLHPFSVLSDILGVVLNYQLIFSSKHGVSK